METQQTPPNSRRRRLFGRHLRFSRWCEFTLAEAIGLFRSLRLHHYAPWVFYYLLLSIIVGTDQHGGMKYRDVNADTPGPQHRGNKGFCCWGSLPQ